MRRLVSECNFLLRPFVLAGFLVLAFPVEAGSLTIRIDRVSMGSGSAEAVQLSLAEASADVLETTVAADNLESGLGWRFAHLDWHCPLKRQPDAWRCAGDVRAGGVTRTLAVALDDTALRAELSSGRSRLALFSAAADRSQVQVKATAIPVDWAQPFLATLWATAQPSQGRFGGELVIVLGEANELATRASLRLESIGLDTPDGSLAAQNLSGGLDVDYRARASGSRLVLSSRLDHGELLFGNVYVGLSGAPVSWSTTLEAQTNGRWSIPAFEWQDAGTLSVQGSGEIDATGAVTTLRLQADSADLKTLAARYLSGPLGLAGLTDVTVSGAVGLSLAMQGGRWSELRLEPRRVNLVDAAGRFRFDGLDGDVRWTTAGVPQSGAVSWLGAGLHGIDLGPARIPLTSRDQWIELDQPVSIALLGGRLQLDHLRIEPSPDAGSGKAAMGFTVIGLEMLQLSQALGWPAFAGSLSGRLPSARYADQRLEFDGGLSMQVFDGSVALQHLVMERPFGVAPSLAADIDFAGLDLEPLTAAFGFGEITGRLEGTFRNLRLLDWQPVAFEARLRSDPDYKGRKRISQRAVQDISNIGGSGLVAGIQGQALRMFSTFGYSRLGLSCRLANAVCLMDGVGSAGDGYIIVKGAGLPRVDVVGFQRRVDWPVLVARLKAATEGQTPLID